MFSSYSANLRPESSYLHGIYRLQTNAVDLYLADLKNPNVTPASRLCMNWRLTRIF